MFDGDGEFGSKATLFTLISAMLTTTGDLFDEADFVVSTTGNPDEITLDPDSLKRQPPVPTYDQTAQQRTQADISRLPGRPNPALVTPSRPVRSWTPAPGPRQPNQIPQQNNPPAPNGQYMGQRRPAPGPQNFQNARSAPTVQSRPNQDSIPQVGGGQLPAIKRESTSNSNDSNKSRGNESTDILPPNGSPSIDNNQRLPGPPAAAFFSARAVDMLRDNPNIPPTAASQFDPHAESPSIRKTAGFDHSKSIPITKPMLAGASPAANHTRDFINPSADMHRKIGAPGGAGIGSPLNRGQTTSSYRPLTRPNIDPRNVAASNNKGGGPGGLGPQSINNNANININNNGKRPPLSDVTNATSGPGPGGNGDTFVTGTGTGTGSGDPKRLRVNGNDGISNGLPQQPQH